ncbi:MAG: NAD-dependent epimerase/dehydratase family protein, partial [Bryobacteraceae bacterium]
MNYQDRKVLITGGLGFIGSNLAIRAVALGAQVTVVDSAVPGCGAMEHNLAPISGRVRLIPLDIGQASEFRDIIARSEVIFNLAGEVSHLQSMELPERDLEINTTSQLRFLNVCKVEARGVRIVYAGTRQIYGVPQYLPVDEMHPINPVDFNGIHKYAATMYHLMLTRAGHLDAMVLRLTNVYGPRMALHLPSQGFLSTYLRRMLRGEALEVFGDGQQVRDVVYVDDVVNAFLIAGLERNPLSRTYNVGGPEPLAIGEIARLCSRAAGDLAVGYREFPAALKTIDIGGYVADRSLIEKELGWTPGVHFAQGIANTLAYYRRDLRHYLNVGSP